MATPEVKAARQGADGHEVTLSATQDRVVGENAEDLRTFLHGLTGCPPVTHTVPLRCPHHGEEAGDWFYVEADPVNGVARRRCVACGAVTSLLDSAEHWTYPPMYACQGCGQSLLEVALGIALDSPDAADAGRVQWLAVGGRCVDCGRICGLTDMTVPLLTVGEVAARC